MRLKFLGCDGTGLSVASGGLGVSAVSVAFMCGRINAHPHGCFTSEAKGLE